jgi:hypothetical protein
MLLRDGVNLLSVVCRVDKVQGGKMTHQELLVALDEEIYRLQQIRAALLSGTADPAGCYQTKGPNELTVDRGASTLQSNTTLSSTVVAEESHPRVVAQKKEPSGKWSLY